MSIQVGQSAPSFALFNTEKQKVSLDEQKGKPVVLLFFPKEAAKAFGVLYETFPAFEMLGVSKRAAFVIDKDGVVKYAEVCPTPGDLPDFAAIQATLASL